MTNAKHPDVPRNHCKKHALRHIVGNETIAYYRHMQVKAILKGGVPDQVRAEHLAT